MATIPHPHRDPTLDAMNAAIEADGNRQPPRPYLGMSGMGKPCMRAIWYDFRWATKRQIAAAGLRAIQDGYDNEVLTAKRLRMIEGITLWTEGEDGQQIGCEDLSGHFRGHLDGVIQGLLQAPKTPHVWENKAVNEKKFNALKKLIADLGEKQALLAWDTTYHAQAQLYMHYQKLTRHYLTVSTPGGRDTIGCRTAYDKACAEHYIELAKKIIASESPPVRLSEDPAHWQCKWCDHHAVCHAGEFPCPTCRSCAHVTPMLDEQGGWHCRKWDDRIPVDAQREGCDQHLYHPEILSHVSPVNGNMDQGWIAYQLEDGASFTNGNPLCGGTPSQRLYAAQHAPKAESMAMPEEPSIDALQADVLTEISADSAIPTGILLSGDLPETEWPKVTEAVVRFSSRWDKEQQPERYRALKALIEVIDSAYMALAEKADAARVTA